MINIKIEKAVETKEEAVDFLNEVATRIKDGYKTGMNWDLEEDEDFEDLSEKKEEVCNTCGGTGEVTIPGKVWPGEPHLADVDSGPCPDCRRDVEDTNSDEEPVA